MPAGYVTTKTELLAAIHQNWAELHAWLGTLTEQQCTQPTDAAGWTVKDHVAHLWVWEDGMNAFLQRQSRPQYMQIPAELWGDDFDPLNAVIQQRHKDLPWSEVSQRFAASHEQLLARLEALSDADLQRPYNHYQPEEEYTSPAINSLAGNTFHHYAEHLPWMQAIVASYTP